MGLIVCCITRMAFDFNTILWILCTPVFPLYDLCCSMYRCDEWKGVTQGSPPNSSLQVFHYWLSDRQLSCYTVESARHPRAHVCVLHYCHVKCCVADLVQFNLSITTTIGTIWSGPCMQVLLSCSWPFTQIQLNNQTCVKSYLYYITTCCLRLLFLLLRWSLWTDVTVCLIVLCSLFGNTKFGRGVSYSSIFRYSGGGGFNGWFPTT